MTDKLILFIDWDETITSHDTLSLIAPPDDQHEGKDIAKKEGCTSRPTTRKDIKDTNINLINKIFP